MATVPIGYGDGWRRALTNNCDVLIRGRRHPLVGTVSMDNVTVALGAGHRRRTVGDEVVLIGAQGEERILAEEVARRLDTINYEVTCALLPRVRRRARAGEPGLDRRRRGARRAARAARCATSTSRWRATPRRPRARAGGRAARAGVPALGGVRRLARDRPAQAVASTTSRRSRATRSRRTCAERDFTVNAMAPGPASRRRRARSTRSAAAPTSRPRTLRVLGPEAYERDPLRAAAPGALRRRARLRARPETERLTAAAAPRVTEAAGRARVRGAAPARRRAERARRACSSRTGSACCDAVLPELDRPPRRGAEPLPPPRRLRPHARGAGAADRARGATGRAVRRRRSAPERVLRRAARATSSRAGRRCASARSCTTSASRPPATCATDGRVTFMGHDAARRGDGARRSAGGCARASACAASSRRLTRHHLVLGFLVHERPLDRARGLPLPARARSPVEVEVTLLSLRRPARHPRAKNADEAIAAHLELAARADDARRSTGARSGPPRGAGARRRAGGRARHRARARAGPAARASSRRPPTPARRRHGEQAIDLARPCARIRAR